MLRMADHEGLLDIYNTVKELRQRRVNMVANLEQYIFLHDALLEAVLCGETGVSAQELGMIFKKYRNFWIVFLVKIHGDRGHQGESIAQKIL